MSYEIWKPVPEFENLYEINNRGDVRSLDKIVTYYDPRWNRNTSRIWKSHPIKQFITSGYYFVSLRKDNEYHFRYVHRLVAQVFIPNPNNKPQVNHKNGDKKDNNVDNLEWVTESENIQHLYSVLGFQGGMKGKHLSKEHKLKLSSALKGKKHIKHNYTENSIKQLLQSRGCKPVRCMTDNKTFRSAANAADFYKCCISTVLSSIRSCRPTRTGLQFEYISEEEFYNAVSL